MPVSVHAERFAIAQPSDLRASRAAVTAQVHALARLFGVLEDHPSVEAYATVAGAYSRACEDTKQR